jgi:hypothetical protein
MFYALDKETNELISSLNMREINYKNTYNYKLKFKCCGFDIHGKQCNDNNIVYVNSFKRDPHFRHSTNNKCSAYKNYVEFNTIFYKKWFNLFKPEYRKPYWYNYKLEMITNETNIFLIRYAKQKPEFIKSVENYVKKEKITWILSLENRHFNKIQNFQNKIYVDFIGGKNDIPLYNNNKSNVYLDTNTNILLKVILDSTNHLYGQEIEIINIYDFCYKYDYLLYAYPYRNIKDTFYLNFLNKQKEYIEKSKILLLKYNIYNDLYNENNDLNYFYNMCLTYDKLLYPKLINFNYEYCNKFNLIIEYVKKIEYYYRFIINNKIDNIDNKILDYFEENKLINIINEYENIMLIINKLNNLFTDITYLEKIIKNFNINNVNINYNIYKNKLERNYITKVIYLNYESEINIIQNYDILTYSFYIELEKNNIYKNKLNKNNITHNINNNKIKELLLIIEENNKKINQLSVLNKNKYNFIKLLKQHYYYITYPLNYNIDKMIDYINKQEEVLNK